MGNTYMHSVEQTGVRCGGPTQNSHQHAALLCADLHASSSSNSALHSGGMQAQGEELSATASGFLPFHRPSALGPCRCRHHLPRCMCHSSPAICPLHCGCKLVQFHTDDAALQGGAVHHLQWHTPNAESMHTGIQHKQNRSKRQ